MSTRSLVRFAERKEGVSFSEHPERIEVQNKIDSLTTRKALSHSNQFRTK